MHRHQRIIFLPNFILSRFYVTLYLLSCCVFHFNWCRAHTHTFVYIYIYEWIYSYVYICLQMHVTMYTWLYVCFLCVLILCILILWRFFFTYGCLVRDDLIKKLKKKQASIHAEACAKQGEYHARNWTGYDVIVISYFVIIIVQIT